MFKSSKGQYSRRRLRAHPYRSLYRSDSAARIRHPSPIPQPRTPQHYLRHPSPIPQSRTSQYYRRTQRFVSSANSTPLGPETAWRPRYNDSTATVPNSSRNSGNSVTQNNPRSSGSPRSYNPGLSNVSRRPGDMGGSDEGVSQIHREWMARLKDARLHDERSRVEIEEKLERQMRLTEEAENARIRAEDYIKEEMRWRGEVEQQLETQIGFVKEATQAQVVAETKLKLETNRRIDLERELEKQVRSAEEAIQAQIRSQSQLEEERRHRMEVEQAQIAAEVRTKEESSRRIEAERQLEIQNRRTAVEEQSRIMAELRVEKETRARQVAEHEMMGYAEMHRSFRVECDGLKRLLTEARIQTMIEAQKRAEIEERLREQEQLVSHLQARVVVEHGCWNSDSLQGQPAAGSRLKVDVSMSSIPDNDHSVTDMDASMSSIPASDTINSVPARTPSPPLSNNPSPDPSSPQPVPRQAQTQIPSSNDSASDSFAKNSRTLGFRSAVPSREPSPFIANNSTTSGFSFAHVPPPPVAAFGSSPSVPLREPSPPAPTSSPSPYTPPPLPESEEDWFELYESRWQGIRRSTPPACSLTFAHFPWPVFRYIDSVNELHEQEVKDFFISKYRGVLDRKWKEELRRWHTDKLAQMLRRIHPSCTAEVEEGFLKCIKVVTALTCDSE